ncbi:hypothetical protein CBS147347_11551 [Aspergillus niger]|nr:hypothetical protein CBS147347_11551 [Aspergillus niger]
MPAYPDTELYVKFVDAGEFPHIGQGKQEAEIPDKIRNLKQDISEPQKRKLIAPLTEKIATLLKAETQVPPIFGKAGSNAKEEWEKLLSIAVEKQLPHAAEALEKLDSLQVSEDGGQEDQPEGSAGGPSTASPSPGADSRGEPDDPGADLMEVDSPQGTENNDQQEDPQANNHAASGAQSSEGGTNSGQQENQQANNHAASGTQPSVVVKREESPSRSTAKIPSPEVSRPRPGYRLESDQLDEVPCENFGWTELGEDKCHDWPWVTMPLPNGGAIMAEKETNRQSIGHLRAGKEEKISWFVVEIPIIMDIEGSDKLRTEKVKETRALYLQCI